MSEEVDPSRLSPMVPEQPALPDILYAQIERAAEYARASRAPSTRRA